MPKDPTLKDATDDTEVSRAEAAPPAKGGRAKQAEAAPPAKGELIEGSIEDFNIPPGTVVKDDGEYEEVVVRRKKAARPTGRYIATANYRCSVDDEKVAKTLEKQGANVSRHRYDKDHELAGRVTFHVLLPAASGNGPAPSFDLPPELAEHALAVGAVTEELR
jgi:hypothetical protein